MSTLATEEGFGWVTVCVCSVVESPRVSLIFNIYAESIVGIILYINVYNCNVINVDVATLTSRR